MIDEEVEMEKLFNEIIEQAILQSASDIHFIPCDKNVSIKFRVQGDIEEYSDIDDILFFVCQNKLDNFSSSMKLINTSNGVL